MTRTKTKPTSWLLLFLLLGAGFGGCRGGGTFDAVAQKAYEDWEPPCEGEACNPTFSAEIPVGCSIELQFEDLLEEKGFSMPDAGVGEVKDEVQSGDALLGCPYAPTGGLPVETESSEFENADSAAQAQKGGSPNHYICDVLGNEDSEQIVRGQAVYGVDLPSVLSGAAPDGLPNEWVTLYAFDEANNEYITLARVQTNETGQFEYRLTEEQRLPLGQHKIFVVVEGDQTCASGAIMVYPQGMQFVVTDLDETMTISDEEMITHIGDEEYVPLVNEGGPRMMQKYVKKGYPLFYLTARPYHLRRLTRWWAELPEVNMPFAYLQTAPKLVEGESAVEYKGGFLILLRDRLGFEAFAAYGNAESDIQGYIDAQVPSEKQFIIGKNAGKLGSVALDEQVEVEGREAYTYLPHTASFVDTANVPDLCATQSYTGCADLPDVD